MRHTAVLPGVGAIAFSVLTFVGFVVENPPGGRYRAAQAIDFVALGHLPAVLACTALALLGVLGLICLLAYLRRATFVAPNHQLAADIFWGTGLAAAASFAVGWGLLAGQPIAHAEAMSDLATAPTMTYLLSEVGVVIIFGPGAMLLGVALIVLMLASRATLPGWLRWLTLLAGVAGVVSLAYFPFFLLLLWGIVVGVWLLTAGRDAAPAPVAAPPGSMTGA